MQEERRELARLRHNHALSKVKMEKVQYYMCTLYIVSPSTVFTIVHNVMPLQTLSCIMCATSYMYTCYIQEKQEMLQQLKVLEREDRTLRQKALATMPVGFDQCHIVHVHVQCISLTVQRYLIWLYDLTF